MNRPRESDIAVTVLGGYLGAGKTTLLNHILRTADERVAVVVNDFGDINIDEALIESNDGDTLALANGCICCSIVDGFGSALETINGLEPRPERLVIEASGVADPAAVAAWGHGRGFRLDAIVVVVDAETIRQQAVDRYIGDTVMSQLRAADIALLNKVDLCEPSALAETREWLGAQCPDAVVVEATNAAVDPVLLFGIERGEALSLTAHIHAEEIFETWSTSSTEPSSREAIDKMMAGLPDSVVRAKGIIWLGDEPDRQMVLQRVGRRWSLRKGKAWPADATPATQLVFIGIRTSEI